MVLDMNYTNELKNMLNRFKYNKIGIMNTIINIKIYKIKI